MITDVRTLAKGALTQTEAPTTAPSPLATDEDDLVARITAQVEAKLRRELGAAHAVNAVPPAPIPLAVAIPVLEEKPGEIDRETRPDGAILVRQDDTFKSGAAGKRVTLYALTPDKKGELYWKTMLGESLSDADLANAGKMAARAVVHAALLDLSPLHKED
jgi:hypothetical protein